MCVIQACLLTQSFFAESFAMVKPAQLITGRAESWEYMSTCTGVQAGVQTEANAAPIQTGYLVLIRNPFDKGA